MINTTPISSYNMQNAYQLGQIMQEQDAYTPSINPLASSLAVPAGYSLSQWQQELSLAREQYLVRPVMATGNLLSTSFGTALLFKEMASGASGASAAFAQSVGRTIGEGVGWGVGQGIRGGLRFGEASANYITGGAFSKGNAWLAEKTGFRLQRMSSLVDKGATQLNGWINSLSAQRDLLANTALRNETFAAMRAVSRNNSIFAARAVELQNQLKAAKAAKDALEVEKVTAAIAENQAAIARGQKAVKAIYSSGLAKAAPRGLKAFKDLSSITTRMGGAALGFVGTFFSPAFLLKQAIIDRAIDYGVESYDNYNTRMDMHREILAKGGRVLRFGDAMFSQGIEGGLSEVQRTHLVNYIDRMAANDYTVRRNDWFGMGSQSWFGGHRRYSENLKELKALLSVSTDMGMLDMSRSLDEVEKRFETIVKAVKKMSRITGKSKGELAMALASTQQSEARFNINDATASLQRKIYAATVSGASLQTILQESAMGAQMGVQAGIGKAAGADYMISARNIYGRMYRKGMLDRGDIDMMGGEQGVVSSLAAGMMSMTNNNVFKAQLAMFFDPNTGRMDRRRMREYMNGDMKNTMREATERNIAMNTMSYNPFTGREEMGGRLNARMAFVERALQHGDIKMPDLIRFSRQMMKENEAVWGRANAQRMMMGFFTQTVGLDRAGLLMRAMNDDSLMKPDLREQLAVSRKQLEDRYTAEYNRANTFWTKAMSFGGAPFMTAGIATGIATALGASGPLGWGILGAGLAANLAFGNKIHNFMLSHGANAMSPEMMRIKEQSDPWYYFHGDTGIEKYNRRMSILEAGFSNASDSEIVNIYTNFKNNYKSILRDPLSAEFLSKKMSAAEFKAINDRVSAGGGSILYNAVERYSELNRNEYGPMSWHKAFDELKNKLGIGDGSFESYIMTGKEIYDEEKGRSIQGFLNSNESVAKDLAEAAVAKLIDPENGVFEADARKIVSERMRKLSNYAVLYTRSSLNNLKDFDIGSLRKQLGLDSFLMNDSDAKGILSIGEKYRTAGINNAVYRAFLASDKELEKYYKEKGLSKVEIGAAKLRDKARAEEDLWNENWVSGAMDAADVFNVSYGRDTKSRIQFIKKYKDFISSEGFKALEDQVGHAFINDWVTSGKTIEDYIKSSNVRNKQNILDLILNDKSNISPAESTSDVNSETENTDSITGDSKLNQEILKTLKSLNSTLTNLNTGMGYGARQVSDWF